MKKLCVLEQSGTLGDPYTAVKRQLFNTDDCDLYRLNWRHENDPDATISAPGVLWSEGRSILYESVPKTYDYYMFIDDDLDFQYEDTRPLTTVIIELLEEYRPLSAGFYCKKLWGKTPVTEDMRKNKRAYPFLCLDLQLTIYSRQFANLVFPVIFHGSDMCMWYAFWLANKLNPGKQLCFSDIIIKNTRSEPHYNQSIRKYSLALSRMFNRITVDRSFAWTTDACITRNNELYHEVPDKGSFDFNMDDIYRYCNWSSIYVKQRAARMNWFHKIVVNPQYRLDEWRQNYIQKL